jgi:hypothetical protein
MDDHPHPAAGGVVLHHPASKDTAMNGAIVIMWMSTAIVLVGVITFMMAPGKTLNELMYIFYGGLGVMGFIIGAVLELMPEDKV